MGEKRLELFLNYKVKYKEIGHTLYSVLPECLKRIQRKSAHQGQS